MTSITRVKQQIVSSGPRKVSVSPLQRDSVIVGVDSVTSLYLLPGIYAWFNFTCYHPPPGQPRGQVQPFGPGGGELFEAVLCRGEGGGANRK